MIHKGHKAVLSNLREGITELELSEDYVIALEMHMFRKDAGVFKLEDMILISDKGNELLTRSPRRLLEI